MASATNRISRAPVLQSIQFRRFNPPDFSCPVGSSAFFTGFLVPPLDSISIWLYGHKSKMFCHALQIFFHAMKKNPFSPVGNPRGKMVMPHQGLVTHIRPEKIKKARAEKNKKRCCKISLNSDIVNCTILKLEGTNMKDMRTVFDESTGTIMRNAMKARGMTQVQLSEKLGILQSTLSGNMNRRRISVDVFSRTMDALDFDLVVVDRENGEMIWKVEVEK